jgi:integrase
VAQGAIVLDQPERDQTRTELTLTHIGRAWQSQARGREFTEALVDFLRAHANRNTLRSYSFSVLEFFTWYEREHRFIAVPAEVRRGDAIAFERWLRERRYGLREYNLRLDPTRQIDAAIYELVRARPGVRIGDIAATLGLRGDNNLGKRLACLVEVKTLTRTPSIAQIRRGEVDVGLDPDIARRIGIDYPVPTEVFRYFVPGDERSEAERASTIATRLSALSALWDYLSHSGENVGSGVPLIRVNIFKPLLGAAQRQAPTQQKVSRADKTPGMSLFAQLLATTYSRRYGKDATQMAMSRMLPRQVAAPPVRGARETYTDLRDRALMLVLGQTGVRADELGQLRRRDVAGDPPIVTVRGKGGKKRQIRLPPAAYAALEELTRKLQRMARHQARYHGGGRADELLGADAPLLPAVAHWGKNAGVGPMSGLGRAGIAMMLRRRAIAAGIEPGSTEFARVHPHGLRHLFAKAAIESGTPVNVVQAVMGHASGATTLKYMEEHRPDALIAAGFAVEAPVTPPAPRALPPRPAAVAPAATPAPEEFEPPFEPPTYDPDDPTEFEIIPEPPIFERMPVVEPEAEPEPEPERPLIGVGAVPEPAIDEQLVAEVDEVQAHLDRIYEHRWGEKGDRARLKLGETAVREAEQGGFGAELAGILGIEVLQEEREAATRLTHAYVGDQSGLVWWAGPTGKLSPEMPVMSPGQAAACDPDADNPVCRGLVALWRQWASGGGRGPTAASALVLWLAEALEVAAQVNAEVEARDGFWVPSDSAWEDTSEDGVPRRVFREQDPAAIVAWFEAQAWQHRRARTRQRNIIDAPLDAPPYYGSADPIADLDDSERSEMLDWVAALSDQMPRDRAPRFDGASRADLARLLGQMCLYDQQLDVVRDENARRRRGEGSLAELRAAETGADQAGREVDRLVGILGGPLDFDFIARTQARVARRKGVGSEKAREQRQTFYLRTLRDLFGDAADDPALRLVALCGKTPLGDPRYRDLLKVDWYRRTIHHDPAYARSFAKETGAHSECVARRLARDLWELHKKHLAGSRQRFLTRPDELVEAVEAMRSYRVPCPDALERQLRGRLGRSEPTMVYETWSRAVGGDTPMQTARERAIEADIADLQEEYSGAVGAEFMRTIFEPNQSGSALLPAPPELVAAVLVR